MFYFFSMRYIIYIATKAAAKIHKIYNWEQKCSQIIVDMLMKGVLWNYPRR